MKQIARPATIIVSTVGASAMLLIAVLVAAARTSNSHSALAAALSIWSSWTVGSIALFLVGFAITAVMVAAGSVEGAFRFRDINRTQHTGEVGRR
jgi:hypothetical protein